MKVFFAKRVREKIQEYFQRPNQAYRHAADRMHSLLYSIANDNLGTPITYGNIGLPQTNHGETRIDKCIKYHIGFQNRIYDGVVHFRVVTIELTDIDSIIVVFFGDKTETENWINSNRGYQIIVREEGIGQLFEEVLSSGKVKLELDSALIQGKLFKFIEGIWDLNIRPKLSKQLIEAWENIESNIQPQYLDILNNFDTINDEHFKQMLYDTFIILRSGEIKKAINRIRLYFNENYKEPSHQHRDKPIIKNDSFINLRDLSKDELNQFMNLDYDDVIVYLHPDQEKYTKEDYNSPVRISGVSGSGKTSILLNRSVNLAIKYLKEENNTILVLTLQTALTELLKNGVSRIIESKFSTNKELTNKLKNNIKVKSLWELISELIIDRLANLQPEEQFVLNRRLTERRHQGFLVQDNQESIEEMWDIFYKYPLLQYPVEPINKHLFKIHQYILSKGIDPCKYIKDEFDYIRSFLSLRKFPLYLYESRKNRLFSIEKGRKINNEEANRYAILEGLKNWQEFMRFNGITDYPELAIILLDIIHRDPINKGLKPIYRSILIDECQDLGTNELSIIRSLVDKNMNNDLFMVGDLAQKIHVKRLNFSEAKVNVGKHLKLTQNYRNSAEILMAADKVLQYNWKDQDGTLNDDILIKDAEFSNQHSGKINVIKCDNFHDELLNAIHFIDNEASVFSKIKSCLVICGYTKNAIERLKQNNHILEKYIVLNTIIDYKVNDNRLTKFIDERFFISDLDHCKGFEFDTVVIINANATVIPSNTLSNQIANEDFSNNEISKFYVAMTRAKTNLIISYSTDLTEFLEIPNKELHFNESKWKNIFDKSTSSIIIDSNEERIENPVWKYTGYDFLFTKYAIGLSKESQEKVIKVVSGKRVDEKIKNRSIQTEFKDIASLYSYINNKINYTNANKLFGVNLEEIKKSIEGLSC